MYQQILVGTDGSEPATAAVRHAIEFANRFDATLHAVSVVDTRTASASAIVEAEAVEQNLRDICTTALREVERRAREAGVSVETAIETGVPVEELLAYADANDVDHIVVGERGHSAYETVMLGSTTEAIIHESNVPVTVI
jgi:nucleotide-binding universal stress UspA family protein